MFAPTDLCALHWRPDFALSGHECQHSCAALPIKRHVCCYAAASVSTASETHRQHTSESAEAAKRALISLASEGRASLSLQRRGVMEEAQVLTRRARWRAALASASAALAMRMYISVCVCRTLRSQALARF